MSKASHQATQEPPMARKPRKHVSQMTQDERNALVGFVRSNCPAITSASEHFLDRGKHRVIYFRNAVEAFIHGWPIEVSMSSTGPRTLFRDEHGICAVLNLRNLLIVTAYYNHPDDQHETMDKSQYAWKVDVVKLLKELT